MCSGPFQGHIRGLLTVAAVLLRQILRTRLDKQPAVYSSLQRVDPKPCPFDVILCLINMKFIKHF